MRNDILEFSFPQKLIWAVSYMNVCFHIHVSAFGTWTKYQSSEKSHTFHVIIFATKPNAYIIN
jgi:hypothetical protein